MATSQNSLSSFLVRVKRDSRIMAQEILRFIRQGSMEKECEEFSGTQASFKVPFSQRF